jgi:hypothetical protein
VTPEHQRQFEMESVFLREEIGAVERLLDRSVALAPEGGGLECDAVTEVTQIGPGSAKLLEVAVAAGALACRLGRERRGLDGR